MSILPIKFPNEQERLQRLIEADRGKSFVQRVQAIDGLLATVARFETSEDESQQCLRDQREAEFRACWYELAQRARAHR